MEKELVLQEQEPVTLKESQYPEVAKWVEQRRKKSEADRKKMIELGEECERWYNCDVDYGEKHLRQDYVDFLIPPIVTEAVDSTTAFLQPMMMPKDDKWFILQSRQAEDQDELEAQEKWVKYCFDVDDFSQKFTTWLGQRRLNDGSGGFKVVMKKEYSTALGDDSPSLTFFSPSFLPLSAKDFYLYPVYGDVKKRLQIHRTRHTLGDLLDFDIDEEQGYFISQEYRKWLMEEKEKKEADVHTTFTMDEAWIPEMRLPDGTMFQNVVATVVQGKYLIRFANNDYPNGTTPFLWDSGDGDTYGYPFVAKGLGLVKSITGLMNDIKEGTRLGILPCFSYLVSDNVFDPNNVSTTAGSFIPVERHDALNQINVNLNNNDTALQMMAMFKEQFESITINQVIKSGIASDVQQTATAINQQTNNSASRLRMIAYGINTRLLKKAVEMVIDLSHAYCMQEVSQYGVQGVLSNEETLLNRILKVTGGSELSEDELQQALKSLKPSRMLNTNIVGFENSIQRQQQSLGMQQLAQMAEDPEVKAYLDIEGGLKQYCLLNALPADILLKKPDALEREQQQAQQAQQQQQQMMMQDAQQKMQLEVEKLKLEAQKAQAEVELRKADLALKNAEIELKHLEFEQRSKMEESQANEAKKNDKKEDKGEDEQD
jgi:hypothetical protein